MPVKRLMTYLEKNGVAFETLKHPRAYTAQEVAAECHISGWEVAKTVIVKLEGEFAMAVLPASEQVDFEMFEDAAGVYRVELASEAEFMNSFPGCDLGAMPPFGNLYGMKVYVAPELAEDDFIAFNAGSHTELIRMSYQDFETLVDPLMLPFAVLS